MPPKPNRANNQAHRGSSSIRFHPRERRFAEFGREGGEFDRSTEVHSSSPVRPFVRSFIRGRRPSIHPISHSLEPPIEIEAFACHVRARVGCSRIKNTRHGRRIEIDHGSRQIDRRPPDHAATPYQHTAHGSKEPAIWSASKFGREGEERRESLSACGFFDTKRGRNGAEEVNVG